MRFPDETEVNIAELLSAGEPGIALEVLCAQLLEFDMQISLEMKNELVCAEDAMGMSVDEIQGMKVLIKK